MEEEKEQREQQGETARPEPVRLRLPKFLIEEEIGLGDVIKRATYAIGIKPCLGCERRAASLNRRITFRR